MQISSRAGLCNKMTSAVSSAVEKLVNEGLVRNGLMVSVYSHGEPACSVWASSASSSSPMDEDSLVMAYSVAKGVAATALCVAVSRAASEGRLSNSFDSLVSEAWPRFIQSETPSSSPKRALTIAQVAGYRGGMTEHPPLLKLAKLWFEDRSWRTQVGVS